MSEQQIKTAVDKASVESIVGLISAYFKVAQALLFILALVFSVVVVGVLVAGKILLSTISLVNVVSAQRRKLGASI